MKTTRNILLLLGAILLSGCNPKKSAEIEMLDMSGTWTPVITVHGFYDNDDAANDVIAGLQTISAKNGTVTREYRLKPEN